MKDEQIDAALEKSPAKSRSRRKVESKTRSDAAPLHAC